MNTQNSKAQLIRENNRLRDLLHGSSNVLSLSNHQISSQRDGSPNIAGPTGARSSTTASDRHQSDDSMFRQLTCPTGYIRPSDVLIPEHIGWNKINACFSL